MYYSMPQITEIHNKAISKIIPTDIWGQTNQPQLMGISNKNFATVHRFEDMEQYLSHKRLNFQGMFLNVLVQKQRTSFLPPLVPKKKTISV